MERGPDAARDKMLPPIPPSDVLEMYQVEGQDPITQHSWERYVRSKAAHDTKLKRLVTQEFAITNIASASPHEQAALIREALAHASLELQMEGMEMILYAPRKEQAELIKEALTHASLEVQLKGARTIRYAPRNEQAELIKEALTHASVTVQLEGAEMIQYAPKEEQNSLRQVVVNNVRNALAHTSVEVQVQGAEMIHHAPEEEQAGLIRNALAHTNVEVQAQGAWMIGYAPEEEQGALRQMVVNNVRNALTHASVAVQMRGAEMIQYAPKEEQGILLQMVVNNVRNALTHASVAVQMRGARMIRYAPRKEQAELIKEALTHASLEVQLEGAEMIQYAPRKGQAELIRNALAHASVAVQMEGMKMIQYAPENERTELTKEVLAHGLGSALIRPPLYDASLGTDATHFSRIPFPKTGSETTLLGGTLKGKVITRTITPRAFLAWQHIYEDHEVWKKAGFAYVPIEPILSYHINVNGLVNVQSGVLDISMAGWLEKTTMFQAELEQQCDTIKRVLKELKIQHGHDYHDNNFCLRFFRQPDGTPDFTRTPRLYLIDFDQAVSLPRPASHNP